MKRKHFLDQIRDGEIVAAITAAEEKTSGEIRVLISHHSYADPLPVALKHFTRLNMTRTRHRNGILIFVAPRSRTFALLGDTGIHEKCGDDFWQALRDEMVTHFKSAQYTEGIVHAITKAGDLLAAHFPPGPDDGGNELPNAVETD